jgi:hypothetical protein
MLRHCSAKQMGSVLVKMQQNVDALQKSMGIVQTLKEEFASVPTVRVKETMGQDNGLSKAGAG